MKKAVIKNAAIAVIIICVLFTSSFMCGTPEPPFMVDRSNGWIPSFPIKTGINIELIYQDTMYTMWGRLLTTNDYPPYGSLDESEVAVAAEDALRNSFGSAYIDMGTEKGIISENSKKDAWIYSGGETCVIFEKATGRLRACIDTRIQEEFSIDGERGNLYYHCDLADFSAPDLISFHRIASSFSSHHHPDKTDYTLPLSAKDAYNMSAQMQADGLFGSGPMAATGGAFFVYYSEASDAWFIVSHTFIQAISRQTGTQLLLMNYDYREDDRSVESGAE